MSINHLSDNETNPRYSVVFDAGKIDIELIPSVSYLQALQARKVLRHAVNRPLFIKPVSCIRRLVTIEEEMITGFTVRN